MNLVIAAADKADMHVVHLPAEQTLPRGQGNCLRDLMLVARLDVPRGYKAFKRNAAAARRGFDFKLDHRPAGLGHRVGHKADRGAFDRLTVYDGGRHEFDGDGEAGGELFLQHFNLNRAHQLHMWRAFQHGYAQKRVLRRQLIERALQRGQILRRIGNDLRHKDRLAEFSGMDALGKKRRIAEHLPGSHIAQPVHAGNVARAHFAGILAAPVRAKGANLRDFALDGTIPLGVRVFLVNKQAQRVTVSKRAAVQTHPRGTPHGSVGFHAEYHAGQRRVGGTRWRGKHVDDAVEQRVDAVAGQRASAQDGNAQALLNQREQTGVQPVVRPQHAVHVAGERVVVLFGNGGHARFRVGKVERFRAQALANLRKRA